MKEKTKQRQKAWYIANRERLLIKAKLYRDTHKEQVKINGKRWHEANKERLKDKKRDYHKLHYSLNKEKISIKGKAYRLANKDKIKARKKISYQANKKKQNAKSKQWYLNNKEKAAAHSKAWRNANKEKIRLRRNAISQKRRQEDPKFRLNQNIKTHIAQSLKGNKAGTHWEDIVGYTLEKLKKHLEKQFTEGMSWDNYGKDGWHIDHEIPLSVFNFTKPEHRDFKKCWALSNLQPLWAKDNLSKQAILARHFQPSLLI